MLGTGQICLLEPEFVMTGLDNIVNMDLGTKKYKKSVGHNLKFVITKFAIIKFLYK